jgi:hypothetical protein
MPSRARWQALLEQARRALETARDELRAYFDERSAVWQQSDRTEVVTERITAMHQLLDRISDLLL